MMPPPGKGPRRRGEEAGMRITAATEPGHQGRAARIAERRAAHRSRPGGYWVAAADPAAAAAVTREP
jgi:hypothetical protein